MAPVYFLPFWGNLAVIYSMNFLVLRKCRKWRLLRRESTVQAKTTSRFHYSADSLQVVQYNM